MSSMHYFDRRFATGIVFAVLIGAGLLMIAAAMISGRIIPEKLSGDCVCFAAFTSVFAGGLWTCRGREQGRIKPLLSAVCIGAFLWLIGFASEERQTFGVHGLTLCVCILSGGMAAGMICPKARGKKRRGSAQNGKKNRPAHRGNIN